MKKVSFFDKRLLMMFMFGLSNEQNFLLDNSTSYFKWISKDYELTLHDTQIDEWVRNHKRDSVDMVVIDLDLWWDYNTMEEYQSYLNQFNKITHDEDIKILIVDWVGEFFGLDNQIQWLTNELKIDNRYIVSQRDLLNRTGLGVLNNQYQLPLLFYYFYMCDDLYYHPPLPNFEAKDKPFDFVSYFGLYYNHDRNNSEESRYKALYERIDFFNKKVFLPNTFDDYLKPIQKTLNGSDIPNGNWGRYNWYSILESEQAKVKLVFESYEPTNLTNKLFQQTGFLSEKSTKCFTHTQPYILLSGRQIKEKLMILGFKFACPLDYEESIDYVSKVSRGNIDEWISKHKHKFIHNKKLFESIIFNTHPHRYKNHIKFFKDILSDKVKKSKEII